MLLIKNVLINLQKTSNFFFNSQCAQGACPQTENLKFCAQSVNVIFRAFKLCARFFEFVVAFLSKGRFP